MPMSYDKDADALYIQLLVAISSAASCV